MSDQSQTTTNTPSEPVLCKMGCGFFGNQATSGCCSKCWREQQKKAGVDVAPLPVKKREPSEPADASMPDAKSVVEEEKVEEPKKEKEFAAEATPKKKKGKKKQSYKSMMAGMMNAQNGSQKAEKEKDALRKAVGGGAFSKVEKI